MHYIYCLLLKWFGKPPFGNNVFLYERLGTGQCKSAALTLGYVLNSSYHEGRSHGVFFVRKISIIYQQIQHITIKILKIPCRYLKIIILQYKSEH